MLPLVSIIVPAYNAERTMRGTLASAAGQSWANLEIIIVNDGSTDRTEEFARTFCDQDRRARVVRQANGGVAAARNRGITEAKGEWIAPLDADDLWHPRKIERQIAAAGSDARVGLVYNWSRLIDDAGCILGASDGASLEGDVLAEHLRRNFIGNGSTPLIRREALGELRYDPEIDACADYLLQLQVAMRWRFAAVPEYLTGYRVSDSNMSADNFRMVREHTRMYELLIPQLSPRYAREAVRQLGRWRTVGALVEMRRGKFLGGSARLAAAFLRTPGAVLAAGLKQALHVGGRGRKPTATPGKRFIDAGPDCAVMASGL